VAERAGTNQADQRRPVDRSLEPQAYLGVAMIPIWPWPGEPLNIDRYSIKPV
jgi:hypothetical protein